MKYDINNLKLLINNLKQEIPDVTEICKKCGINVARCTMKADNINAIYQKDDNGCGIYINQDIDFAFYRFLVAYLLSYIHLYSDKEETGIVYNWTLYDKQAYSMALNILMPNKVFSKEFLDSASVYQLEYLADKYNITMGLIISKMTLNKEKEKFKIIKMEDLKK